MLKTLYIKNFIIIDEVEIEFENGFSVFTGETGAGKSIIIDAISYALGNRLEQSLIKTGTDSLTIEIVYDISKNNKIKELLDLYDIEYEDELIIMRKINNLGKSITKINHQNVTLSLLKQIMDKQIDIHNQHETHYLLNKNNHINLLDNFISDKSLINEVKDYYQQFTKLQKEYDKLLEDSKNDNFIEFIQAEIKEIEEVDPKIGEDDELLIIDKEINNSQKLIDSLNSALYSFNKNDGINENLFDVIKTLGESNKFYERVNNSYYELIDIFDEINNYRSSLNFSDERINEVQERIYILTKLKRKYGSTIETVLKKKDELIDQLDKIVNRDAILKKLKQSIDINVEKYNISASKLHQQRVLVATRLEKEILGILNELVLEHAKFKIEINNTSKATALGNDDVSFLISLNKGESLKQLNKVASGGELSRMMLGLKTIFSKYEGINTLIFDEIETGVSGQVASAIGKKMYDIGLNVQVFSITHLSQVAAFANNHYHVYKEHLDNTKTNVRRLNKNEIINELAMISNSNTSDAAIKAAIELYESSQNKKHG